MEAYMLYKVPQTIQRNSSVARGVLKWRPAAALVVTAAVLAVSCPLHAGPEGLPVAKFLPLSLAVEAAQAAVAACEQQGLHVSVSVVDRSGVTRVALVGDGASVMSESTARRKAFTSAMIGDRSGGMMDFVKSMPGSVVLDPSALPLAGGLAIKVGSVTLSGIGVGGGESPQKDEACAQAGLDRIKDRLK
jgi:uncharacterized protein GlcG (DUF336 family)